MPVMLTTLVVAVIATTGLWATSTLADRHPRHRWAWVICGVLLTFALAFAVGYWTEGAAMGSMVQQPVQGGGPTIQA